MMDGKRETKGNVYPSMLSTQQTPVQVGKDTIPKRGSSSSHVA
jgi:hypothetical protein